MLEFHLPYPPSVNHYWRRVGPRTLISRGGRLFRKQVCAIVARHDVQPLAGPLEVQVKLYPPDRRRRDIDNTLKAVLDSLQHGGAYEDDNQIVRLGIEKCERTPGGRAVVRISEIEDQ
ncbi:RusA family crossover junction endodeoxyribonuclease [Bremerella sp.]|uniref:RusA family crossover junction endodeoxyribonuclease n=1 Tax=Bremerella sp. TaxID=2795602 RepID=UPI00391B9AA2